MDRMMLNGENIMEIFIILGSTLVSCIVGIVFGIWCSKDWLRRKHRTGSSGRIGNVGHDTGGRESKVGLENKLCTPIHQNGGDIVYADYAGCPPYPSQVIELYASDLLKTMYGNPHSEVGWLRSASLDCIEELRRRTLEMCKASAGEYCCILTSGATAALNMVSDAFPWTENSAFVYLTDNHTSVLGIRNVAASFGACIGSIEPNGIKILDQKGRVESEKSAGANHLFAFPLESNFSGVRYDEGLIHAIKNRKLQFDSESVVWHRMGQASNLSCGLEKKQQIENKLKRTKICTSKNQTYNGLYEESICSGNWYVLMDAAKAFGSHPPDLSKHSPDFVVLSYYKIFGFPTGLGALIVRRDTMKVLEKRYFGGGTSLSVIDEEMYYVRRPAPWGYEDGTLPYLSIPAALQGFRYFDDLGGMDNLGKSSMDVAYRLARGLCSLCHENGRKAVQIYGLWERKLINSEKEYEVNNDQVSVETMLDISFKNASKPSSKRISVKKYEVNIECDQGPTVTFNVIGSDGKWVGHGLVQRVLSLEGIFVRSGVLCNPGACRRALGISGETMKSWHDIHGHVCWDNKDVIEGNPTGAVRASFGYRSEKSAADAIVRCIKTHFVLEKSQVCENANRKVHVDRQLFKEYPIEIQERWPTLKVKEICVYPIKSCPGFSVKSWPITASGLLYDRRWAIYATDINRILTLKSCPKLALIKPEIDLESKILVLSAGNIDHSLSVPLEPSERIGNGILHYSIGKDARALISSWLVDILSISCQLIDIENSKSNGYFLPKRKSFANKSPILATYWPSVKHLHKCSGIQESLDKFTKRFRANIILEIDPLIQHEGSASSDERNFSDSRYGPYAEDNWIRMMSHDGIVLEKQGHCHRCEVICTDPETGERYGYEPLRALTRDKKWNNNPTTKISFGILMSVEIEVRDHQCKSWQTLDVESKFELREDLG